MLVDRRCGCPALRNSGLGADGKPSKLKSTRSTPLGPVTAALQPLFVIVIVILIPTACTQPRAARPDSLQARLQRSREAGLTIRIPKCSRASAGASKWPDRPPSRRAAGTKGAVCQSRTWQASRTRIGDDPRKPDRRGRAARRGRRAVRVRPRSRRLADAPGSRVRSKNPVLETHADGVSDDAARITHGRSDRRRAVARLD